MGRIFKAGQFPALICTSLLLAALLLPAAGCAAMSPALEKPAGPDTAEAGQCACQYQRAIQLGGEWFLRNQNDNFLYYQYDVDAKKYSTQQHPLREMASLWSIARLAHFLKDERFTRLADKGMAYFEPYFRYDTRNDIGFIDMGTGSLKLGETAFIMLSLLEMDYRGKDKYLEKFASGVLFQQRGDGSLRTIYYSDENASVDYYPGEALLAMMSLYEYRQDPAYLECVKKAFPYYADYFRKEKPTAFVPWQTRAYVKLYKATGDASVADFVFEMNDYILEYYAPRDACDRFDMYRGIVTAVYLEGVNKAYELARIKGDLKRQKAYAEFIREAARYTVSLQLIYEPSLPGVAVGGFIVNKNSPSLRVDRNQHAVMALMDACELGLLDKW